MSVLPSFGDSPRGLDWHDRDRTLIFLKRSRPKVYGCGPVTGNFQGVLNRNSTFGTSLIF